MRERESPVTAPPTVEQIAWLVDNGYTGPEPATSREAARLQDTILDEQRAAQDQAAGKARRNRAKTKRYERRKGKGHSPQG